MDNKQSKHLMQNLEVHTGNALFFYVGKISDTPKKLLKMSSIIKNKKYVNVANKELGIRLQSQKQTITTDDKLEIKQCDKKQKNNLVAKKLKTSEQGLFAGKCENKNLSNIKIKIKKNHDKQVSKNIFDIIDSKIDEDASEATQLAINYQDEIKPTEEKRVASAEREVKKKSSKFMNYFYAICLLVNIISFVAILIVIGRDKKPLMDLLAVSGANYIWLIIAALCFVASMSIESLRFYILILRGTKKNRPYISYKTTALGKYYDFITPLSTGGQPFQISYLNKHGIRGSTASSVPVTKYIFSQFTYLIAVGLLLVFGGVIFERTSIISGFVSVTAYIGLAVQFIILVAVILLSNSKKIGPAIVIGILKLANKLKFIKDYKETYIKVLRFCFEYQTAMRSFISNFFTFISMFFSSILVFLLRVSIPFCLYCAFFGFNPNMWVDTVARIMLCELAMGVWILPGNVIFADIAFLALFKTIFTSGTLFWALLFWRILSYYSYILQGIVIKIYDKIKYGVFKANFKMDKDILTIEANKKLKKEKMKNKKAKQ